jgi:peroxiredoxin
MEITMIEIGKKVPNVVFKTRVRDETMEEPNKFRWEDVSQCRSVCSDVIEEYKFGLVQKDQ